MLKKIFTFFLFLFLCFTSLSAQDFKKTGGLARLGGIGYNPYVFDPFFNTVNPAWNAIYNDFVIGDLGNLASGLAPWGPGGGGQYFSGSFSVGNNWTIGGILARNDFNGLSIALLDPGSNNAFGFPFPGVVSTVNGLSDGSVVVPMDNNIELITTYQTDHTSIGFGIAYASTTRDFTPDSGANAEGSANQLGLNLGVVHFAKNITLDLGFSVILPSASYKPAISGAGGNQASADQTIFLVNGRGFLKLNQNLELVPVLVFASVTGSLDSGFTSTTYSVDMISFTSRSVGLGLNYHTGDFILAGGVSFTWATITIPALNDVYPEYDLSANFFPVWNIGAEWHLLDWLVGRLGYFAVTGLATVEDPISVNAIDEYVSTFFGPPRRGATVGVGFRFGDFSLDAMVNEDVLRQGFNVVGGGGPTFAYMTASYAIP